MSKLHQLRIILDDEPQSGAWNMAVDEALLETAIELQMATLRFYRWREATASLGYFQRAEEFFAEPRFANVPAVRRLSGGGTLIHDLELTYSLTLPASQQVVARPVELYRLVHAAFVEVFLRHGVALQQRGASDHEKNRRLLCFTREDESDLILRSHKVLGSAQRRRRGAILQHGGLILKASRFTPELVGIYDLQSQESPLEWGDLSSELAEKIAGKIADKSSFGALSQRESCRAAQLVAESYSTLK